MQKPLTIVLQLLAAGMMLLGTPRRSRLRQRPPPNPLNRPNPPLRPRLLRQPRRHLRPRRAATPLTLKTQKEKRAMPWAEDRRRSAPEGVDKVGGSGDGRARIKGRSGGQQTAADRRRGARRSHATADRSSRRSSRRRRTKPERANRKEGEAFLAANKSKEGVVTLPSGLQYKILTAGHTVRSPRPATR